MGAPLFLPRRAATVQPAGLAQLLRGTLPQPRLAFNAATPFDAASGMLSANAFPIGLWPGGIAAGPFNAAPYPSFATCAVKQSGSFTVVAYGSFAYCNGKGPILSHFGSTGGWKFSVYNSNFSYTQYGVADYPLTTAASGYNGVVVAVVTPGVNIKIYKGGVLAETVTIGAMSASSGNGTLVIGNRNGGTDTPLGATLLAGVLYFESALTDSQIADLSANPWQMFAAPQRILPMATTAGTAVTASPAGVNATAVIGSPSASGDAAAAPSGIAASALVGTATASGGTSASASPAGVAATAAVGSAAPAGDASSAPVGVSASANAGTATAGGSSSAAPSGVSAACAVGTATASSTGAGNATPAGVVATASTGSPTASAAANVTATGVSASGIVASAGQVTAATSSDGLAAPAGVSATAYAGSAAVSAGANVVPIGASATATLGQAVATGGVVVNASAFPAGVAAYGLIGNASAVEMAALQPNPAQTYTGMTRTRAYAGNTRVRQL